jgi:hypothetical protein
MDHATPHVTERALFATRLLSLDFPGAAGLNDDLERLFTERAEFRGDFNMHPDACNLLRLEPLPPCVAALRDRFLDGLVRWLRAEGVAGEFTASVVLFPNIAGPHEYTQVHNHSAEVVGIYYVRTPYAAEGPREQAAGDPTDYFAEGDGVLVLHDPRFNANLAYLHGDDYRKVFPRPGQMLIFPGYVWHSVLPHRGPGRRLSIAANFRLTPRQPPPEYRVPLNVPAP